MPIEPGSTGQPTDSDLSALATSGSTGTGAFVRSTSPNFAAGGGSATYHPCGIIAASTTSAATVADTAETDLWSYTLPANTLNANGQALRIRVFGLTAANGNTKTVKLYFGALAYTVNAATSAPNGVQWFSEAVIIRTGASAQIRNKWGVVGAVPENTTVSTSLASDTTAAITIKITGQNGTASAGDITFSGALVEFCP